MLDYSSVGMYPSPLPAEYFFFERKIEFYYIYLYYYIKYMKLNFVVLFVPDKPQLNNKNCIILGNPCNFFLFGWG